MQEGKVCFFGKHKIYGFKVKISVLSSGVAVSCIKHYPDSVSDLEVFQNNRRFHPSNLEKIGEKSRITDIGLLSEKFSDLWAITCDKRYQRTQEMVLAVIPKKKLDSVAREEMMRLNFKNFRLTM